MARFRSDLTVSRRGLLHGAGAAGAGVALGTLTIPTASAQDAVDITIWTNHPEWLEPLTTLLDAFQASHEGVTMELSGTPGPDYPAKLQTALAGGQPPDVIGLPEGSILSNGVSAYPIADLSGIVDGSTLIDSARAQVSDGDAIYGVPLASYTVGIATQKPILAENGIEVPTTWDELTTASQALLDAGVTPIILGAKDGVHTFFMYIGLVSSVLGPEGFEQLRAGDRSLTDPDLLAAAQFLFDLQPFFNEGFEATDYVTAKALFAQGLAGMMVAGTADFTGFKEENPDADLGFAPWPGPEAGKHATNTGMELLYTVHSESDPEIQEAASTFVAWLGTAEAQEIVAESIALPISTEVTDLSDPIKADTIAVRDQDVIVWYDLPETGNSFTAVSEVAGQLWTGDMTVEEFAAYIQDNLAAAAS